MMCSVANPAANDLISIIIPVYNCDETLEKSIRSCLNQTYTNLEIFLIDDGSTDGSGDLCDRIAHEDSRVKVLHQNNQGVSAARNKGLDISTGDYIFFLDADDLLHPCAIERMYYALVKSGKPLAMCRLAWIRSHKQLDHFISSKPDNKSYNISPKSLIERIIYRNPFEGSCCGKLYVRRVLNGIRFSSLTMTEDQIFIFEVLSALNDDVILTGKLPLYCYTQRKDSAMHTLSSRHLNDALRSADYIKDLAKSTEAIDEKAALCYSVNAAFFALMNSPKDEQYREITNCAISFIKEHRLQMITSSGIPLKTKGACMLSYVSIELLFRIYHTIKHSGK